MERAITRRSAFAGVAKVGAFVTGLTALPALGDAATPKDRVSDAEFIRSIDGLHDNGALAARQALAAGMKPKWLFAVMLGPTGPHDQRQWPALLFGNGQENFTFRPSGRDN